MTRKTHIAIGIAATIPLLKYTSIDFFGVVGIIGATAPDIDLKLGIKHRTITHSLLFLFLSSLFIFLFSKSIAIVWFINVLLHLIADSFTKMGIAWLYPFKRKYYGYKLIRTGGAEDYFITLLLIFIISEMLKLA